MIQVLTADTQKIVGGRVDGMGTVASDVTDLNELCADQIGYFGTSSTVNFVNQVHRILLETNNTVLPSPIGVGHGRSDERLERRLENVHTYETPLLFRWRSKPSHICLCLGPNTEFRCSAVSKNTWCLRGKRPTRCWNSSGSACIHFTRFSIARDSKRSTRTSGHPLTALHQQLGIPQGPSSPALPIIVTSIPAAGDQATTFPNHVASTCSST